MEYNALTPKMALNLAAPHTWAASIGPSVFGCVYCHSMGYNLPLWQCFLLVLACVLMQASVNSFNDYIDFIKGTDTAEDNLERNDAVLLCENINPKSARNLGVCYFSAATIIGIILIIYSACLIPLWIGLIGGFTIIFYSGGKTPISYLPIGELVSGTVMGGLIPLGCLAVALKSWHFEVMIYALPFIISIALIMMSNNGCDIEKDIEAGRKTLPVVLGRARALKVYKTLCLLWFALAIILPVVRFGLAGLAGVILVPAMGLKPIKGLTKLPLNQEHRVEQMKLIIAANIMTNGAYVLTYIIAGIIRLI